MAFTKFDPHNPVPDVEDEHEASARRRAWLLKWGRSIGQWMFYLGLLVLGYEIGHQKNVW